MTPAQGAQYGVINKSSGFGIRKDRRVGILVADGVLYLPIQVGVGTHFLQSQRVFSAGRRGLRDRMPGKAPGMELGPWPLTRFASFAQQIHKPPGRLCIRHRSFRREDTQTQAVTPPADPRQVGPGSACPGLALGGHSLVPLDLQGPAITTGKMTCDSAVEGS